MGPHISAVAGLTLVSALAAGAVVGTPVLSEPRVALAGAVAGCSVFPATSYWHADVRKLAVHKRSASWLSHLDAQEPSTRLRGSFDFPVTVVGGAHPKVEVVFDDPDQSDHVGYPFGDDTRLELGGAPGTDAHAVVVDKSVCRLYETYLTRREEGVWHASNGATWALGSNRLRPDGWASANLAGTPILAGLMRWGEVRDDRLNHALSFVADDTSRAWVWPARHGSTVGFDDPTYPPMGARFRLKGSFSTAGFSPRTKVVIAALKRYGMVLVDRGVPWTLLADDRPGWQTSPVAEELRDIPASAFVAVNTGPLKISADSGRARKIS